MKWNPFRRAERRSLVSWDTGGQAATAVTLERALTLTPVFAAGRLIASNVAAPPLQIYRKSGETREKLPLPSLFVQPSSQGTLYDWLFRATTSMLYRGNAVGLIVVRNTDGFPTTVEWLNPDEVSVQDSQPYGPGSFTNPIWLWRGQPVARENLIHIPWFVMPGRVWGLSPMAAYAVTVATGLAAQKFTSNWFTNGGVPPSRFKNTAKVLEPDQIATIQGRLQSTIRSGKPIVYGADWDFEPITVSPNEAQFAETMRLTATQVAAIYGIPPEMIGGEMGGSYTYSSPEQRQIELLQVTLLPWYLKLESHLSELLPRPQYVKFNIDAILRTDSATRYSNYKTARDIGMMNVDEIRAKEDMPPLPGGAGTDYTPLGLKTAAAVPPVVRAELGRPRLVAGDT